MTEEERFNQAFEAALKTYKKFRLIEEQNRYTFSYEYLIMAVVQDALKAIEDTKPKKGDL